MTLTSFFALSTTGGEVVCSSSAPHQQPDDDNKVLSLLVRSRGRIEGKTCLWSVDVEILPLL